MPPAASVIAMRSLDKSPATLTDLDESTLIKKAEHISDQSIRCSSLTGSKSLISSINVDMRSSNPPAKQFGSSAKKV